MPFENLLLEYEQRKAKALAMGGPEKLAKRKAQGQLNARERLDYLLDEGSLQEVGLFATSSRPEVRDKTPADAKITGFGKINKRNVAVVSNDLTVMGASSAVTNGKKIKFLKQTASKRGLPLIFLGESSGARMPDRMGALGRTIAGLDANEFLRLRETPWVSALLGPCYGSSTWYACMSDFVVMRKGAAMAVSSNKVTSGAIGQPIDAEELGGWRLHSEKSGLVDVVVDTDEQALDKIKEFLDYLPSHHNEMPPEAPVPTGSDAASKRILELLPESRTTVYDVRKIIEVVADAKSVFELKSRFGKSITTSLARLAGRTVGFIANNPLFKGGAMDVDSCNKAISFIVLCDSFNIPIVFLVDQPGFLIGIEGEMRAAPGRIINWMNALPLCTVPRLSIIMRKSYGQGYLNMGGSQNSDQNACWITADLGFMDPVLSVKVVHGITEQDDPVRFKEALAEMGRNSAPWDLGALFETHDIIDPRDTREWLIKALDFHRMRINSGIGQHRLSSWPTTF
jgi:acetyl-CoA carboxylase carboxyltransferase component